MLSTTSRKFRVSDAMILVAAFALGWVLARGPTASYRHFWYEGRPTTFVVKLCVAFMTDIVLTYPWAATAGIAIVILRLLPPRPPLRRVLRLPGSVACLVASLCLPFALGHLARELYQPWTTIDPDLAQRWFWRNYAQKCAMAVLGAWLALALIGRWQAERDWIDRAGRAVGVYWISVAVLQSVFDWLEVLFTFLDCF
jgi:hypothetical protein